jgi:uncharacterized protein (TIGR03437 family)
VNGSITPRQLAAEVVIKVGDQNANVLWGGMVGIGLYQFNIVVPPLPPGDYATSIQILGAQSSVVQLPVR